MSCYRLQWPALGAAIETRPVRHVHAVCPIHGPTEAHTGLYPWYKPSSHYVEGFRSPVYAGCCNRLLGYLS